MAVEKDVRPMILSRVFQENPALYDGLSLERRDPDYIRDYMVYLEFLYRYWFRVDARGFENLDPDRCVLFVANHSGGILTPDTAMASHAWFSMYGENARINAMIHPSIFQVPWLNVHAMKLGGVQATPRMANQVLSQGRSLLLYPGGGADAYRPFWERNTIQLGTNMGFVRLAMRHGIPIVPVVSLGGHNTLIVLSEGSWISEKLGLDKLGVERIPVTLTIPWGITVAAPLHIPYPAKITIEVGPPISLVGFQKASSREHSVVSYAHRHVVDVMQGMLDRLVAERKAKS
jgi:1-acyl-sn-glycerol-3-phosphate acyltransferase